MNHMQMRWRMATKEPAPRDSRGRHKGLSSSLQAAELPWSPEQDCGLREPERGRRNHEEGCPGMPGSLEQGQPATSSRVSAAGGGVLLGGREPLPQLMECQKGGAAAWTDGVPPSCT